MTFDDEPASETTAATGMAVHLQKLVESLACEASVSLFCAYGVSLEVVDSAGPVDGDLLLASVIGFTGPGLRGSCVVASTELPLRQSNPAAGSLRDWIAEVSNQLIGRVKNQLLCHGAEVYVTTPVVMRGKHFAPVPRFVIPPQAFASASGGNVFLWVEVEADPEFHFSASPEPAPAAEGEALLF